MRSSRFAVPGALALNSSALQPTVNGAAQTASSPRAAIYRNRAVRKNPKLPPCSSFTPVNRSECTTSLFG